MKNLIFAFDMVCIETQVFPPTLLFILATEDKILIETNENYQKRSFRNRYYIGQDQNLFHLTIPLIQGKNEQMAIRDVKISYTDGWPAQHLKALQSTYGKSPYFSFYKDELNELLNKRETFLIDFNSNCLQWIIRTLKVSMNISSTDTYQKEYNTDVTDLRSKFIPSTLSEKLLPKIPGLSMRPQCISILDQIFFMGPETMNWIYQTRPLNSNSVL